MQDFNARLKKLLDGSIWKSLQENQDSALSEELSAALDELIILAESEHEALESLERQFAIFVKLAEMCPSFLWIADSEGSMEYVNERWMEFTGATPQQSLGLGWLNFIDERDRKDVLFKWRESVRRTITFEMEFRITSGFDRKPKWYLVRALPLTDEKGEPVKWFGSCTEINEQKTLKEELALRVNDLSKLIMENELSRLKLTESEAMFRIVCETSPHLIITTDARGQVEYFNQQWYNYTGLARIKPPVSGEETLDGNECDNWLSSVHPDQRARLSEKWREARQKQAPLEDEVRLRRADGVYLWHLLRSLPLADDAGKPLRWCISCTDIEAHHSLMKALSEAKENAEEASRFKSAFVANISHELRTPLNGVLGMSQLLSTLTLPEQAQDYLHVIEEAGQSLLAVINDVLDFSKIEAGRLEVASEDLSVSGLIDSSMNILATQAKVKDLFFISFTDPRIPDLVKGDGPRVRQVLLNLLSNAIKFTEIGGVFLSATLVSREPEQCTVKFSILDSGIGVSPDLQQKLFEPFIQADHSISRKYGGTGLGLSISRSLVELLGGALLLQSEPGNGAEFSFTLTFKNAANQLPITQIEALTRPVIGNKNVFITGRSKHMMDRLYECLSMTGLQVSCVTTLQQWSNLLTSHQYESSENYHVSLGKPPKRWMQSNTRESQIKIKRRVIIADPLAKSEGEAGLQKNEIILNAPVKISQVLMAMDGIKSQGISGNQVALDEGEQSLKTSSSRRNYTRTRGFTRETASNGDGPLKRPFKALIADDNAINLRVSKLLLTQFGLEADVAVSGFEALEKSTSQDYDIIFLDCQMPQMDGFDTCRRIRINQAKQGKWAPIIAVTANSFSVVKENYSRSGMDDFLPKPILSDNLLNILSKWLDTEENVGAMMRQPHNLNTTQTRAGLLSITSISIDDNETTEGEGLGQLSTDLLLSRFGTEHVQLLEMFYHSARESVSKLSQHLQDRDYIAVMKQAHAFKGACGTICATSCEGILKSLEKEAKVACYERTATCLGQLKDKVDELLIEIEIYLKTKGNFKSTKST